MSKKKLRQLADIIFKSITWRQAEMINDELDGFLEAYEAAQDEWELDPKNRENYDGQQITVAPLSRRLRKEGV